MYLSVATHMGVRQLMVDKQRHLAKGAGVVMDGRDIGTACPTGCGT